MTNPTPTQLGATCKLPLRGKHGTGKFAILSAIDYDRASQYNWHLHKSSKSNDLFYACRNVYKTRKDYITLFLHNFIIGKKKGYIVDHINRNTLDNRRENLRFVTPLQSNLNRRMFKDGIESVKGYKKAGEKYEARTHSKHLGTFNTAEEAHQRYLLEVKDSL